jgi:hypothetical protein
VFGCGSAALRIFRHEDGNSSSSYENRPTSGGEEMNRILLVALLGLAAMNPTFSAKADAGSIISLRMMTEGLGAPIGLVSIPDGSGRLLVPPQGGDNLHPAEHE